MKSTQSLRKGTFSVAHAARVLGVTPETLARILNVKTQTVLEWMKNDGPCSSSRFRSLQNVVEMLEFTFEDHQSMRSFLRHPNPGLAGQMPLALLKRGQFDLVSADLLAICEGVYI